MYTNRYRYVMTWCKQDGTVLRRAPVQLDWSELADWARFQALVRGQVQTGSPGEVTVEPVWHATAGAPCVGAISLHVEAGAEPLDLEVPASWFDSPAQRGSGTLVQQGLLQAGELFNYVVTASVRADVFEQTATGRSTIQAIEPAIDVLDRPLNGRLDRCVPSGVHDALDARVIMPSDVIDQTSELTQAAGANETGGVLIGNVCRDTDTGEVYLDVTAQVHARYARSDLTKLTFTPETWTDVQDVITGRGLGESMLGWWHSHSYMKETCKDCDKGRDGSCAVSAAFMSGDDVALHRTTFPRAYSLALVVANSPCNGLTWALFGWRYGRVKSRGFHIHRPEGLTGEPTADALAAAAVTAEAHG